MRIGNFSIIIDPGKETSKDYVVMQHGKPYTITMINNDPHRDADCTLSIDGKTVSTFRIGANRKLELDTMPGTGKLLTFYNEESKEAKDTGIDQIVKDDRGVVQAVFIPEKAKKRTPEVDVGDLREVKTSGGIRLPESFSPLSQKRSITKGGPSGQSFVGGGTALSGKSHQQFINVADLDLDHSQTTTLHLRMIGEVQDDTPTPLVGLRSNQVPKAVT